MKIGIAALQGAVSEHVAAFEAALSAAGVGGSVLQVRRRPDLAKVDALAIPGGESTTISRLLVKTGLFEEIIKRCGEGMPVLGTCAGCILLAEKGDVETGRTKTRLLGLMGMRVSRNAFGRQRESFEADVKVTGLLGGPFRAVFIRAPLIEETWGKCRPIARFDQKVVAARQGDLFALAFHPELTGDTRLHELFLSTI
jgi:5'-phosphate synthase pdxT subunit